MSNTAAPIPLSVITGFLGSGKTTLLNQLLRDRSLQNTAIIINEFGDVGIDHLLVETADEGIIELSDGCLCCTVRGDLVDTLIQLLERVDVDGHSSIERIIVETTGLADPVPILHVIMAHPLLVERIRLDGVIVLLDAVNGDSTLDNHPEAVKQVAMADRIVVSKSELQADKLTVDKLVARAGEINPAALILDPVEKPVSAAQLLECGLYNPNSKSLDVNRWLRDEAIKTAGHDHHHHDVNRHDASIRAFTLTHDKPIDASAIRSFLDLLQSAHGPQLLRMKGIVQTSENPQQPLVIHAVQQLLHPLANLAEWPDDDHRTRLVIITKNLSKDFVTRLFDAFIGRVATDTPDRAALEQNPLAVPGFSGEPL